MSEHDLAEGSSGTEDATLGGYFQVHTRPPAFEGSDGHPYTVSIEAERQPDLREPWAVFLIFPRWAETGVGIIGHVETGLLFSGRSEDEVRERAGALSLIEVQNHREEAIGRQVVPRASSDDNDGP